jgi:thiamine-phosphate pyrophosphorylase
VDNKLLAWGLRRNGRTAPPAAPRSHGSNDPTRWPRPAAVVQAAAHAPLPRLWLFTDAIRLPDPRDAVAHLPRGKAGVVLRHDGDPLRPALGRDLAQICRERRLVLVVAGDARLAAALGAGVHLRGGRWPSPVRPPGPACPSSIITSSAHSVIELRRAARAGATLAFLSPAFGTASHIGAPGLGPLRWAALARRGVRGLPPGLCVAALGGVDGSSIRCLPADMCRAAGAIAALSYTGRHLR